MTMTAIPDASPPRRAPIVAITNQKGGCGKTTTAVSLASIFAKQGVRTLLVDLDTQASASLWLLGDYAPNGQSSYELITGKRRTSEVVIPISESLHLVPANSSLGGAEIDLAKATNGEMRLRKALRQDAVQEYDIILVDTPPNLLLCTQNAITSAQCILIPVDSKPQAYESIRPLLALVRELELEYDFCVAKLAIPTIVERTNVSKAIRDGINDAFRDGSILPAIPKTVRLVEAYASRIPIVEYDPAGTATSQYTRAAEALTNAL